MTRTSMTIRARLTIAFGLLTALFLLIAGMAWRALAAESEAFERFVTGINARAGVAVALRLAVDERAVAARNLVLVAKPEDLLMEKAKVERSHAAASTQLRKLQDMAKADDVSEQARALIAEIARVEQQYAPVALNIVSLALQHQREEAVQRMNDDCRPLLEALVKATNAYSEYTERRSQLSIESSVARVAKERNLFLAVVIGAVLMAVSSGSLIIRGLLRDLGAEPSDLNAAASRVATGDLRALGGSEQAPAGSVMASLGAMQGSLVNIVRQVRDASDSIASGSAQIASGSSDLSQRTEQQASALQETATTMDELSATVRSNADHAERANELAQAATAVAGKGGDVMSSVIATMQEIDASSKRIADIIGTIDGISFQTNILALNAAVEAARAGEQGKGFAVVASEVRSLAQRSALAAKEIKQLIGTSVGQVEKGSSLVGEAGETMKELVHAIHDVGTIVREISVACREQSGGVGQVGTAVSQMDEATQQNAALVEESAAAAESLRVQADGLVAAVGAFTVDAPERQAHAGAF